MEEIKVVQNICWKQDGEFVATTWHKLKGGYGVEAECEPDENWDANAHAETLKAQGGIPNDFEVICVDTPIVLDQTLAEPFKIVDGVLRVKA